MGLNRGISGVIPSGIPSDFQVFGAFRAQLRGGGASICSRTVLYLGIRAESVSFCYVEAGCVNEAV